MELKKAIEVVKNIDTTDIHCKNCVLEEKDKCITDLFGYSCQRIAIDTVLEELNNRIPRKDIEDKIEETQQEIEVIKKQKDNIKNGIKILFREGYIENLEEILNKE